MNVQVESGRRKGVGGNGSVETGSRTQSVQVNGVSLAHPGL